MIGAPDLDVAHGPMLGMRREFCGLIIPEDVIIGDVTHPASKVGGYRVLPVLFYDIIDTSYLDSTYYSSHIPPIYIIHIFIFIFIFTRSLHHIHCIHTYLLSIYLPSSNASPLRPQPAAAGLGRRSRHRSAHRGSSGPAPLTGARSDATTLATHRRRLE